MKLSQEPIETTRDAFLNGRVESFQPKSGYRAAVDPVLLAAAVDAQPGQSVLELGCGVGVALLCLCTRVSDLSASGLELSNELAELAARNAVLNGMKFRILSGNIANPPEELRQLSFHHVFANPPYRRLGEGVQPADSIRRVSETESVPLSLWIDLAFKRLRPKGSFTLILPMARLPELIGYLAKYSCGIAARPIRSQPNKSAFRVVVRARKDSRSEFRLAPDLILHGGDSASFSPQAQAILKNAGALEI